MFWTTIGHTECLKDCTKVLVSTSKPIVREQIVKEVPKPKKDDIKVVAYVDDGENKSAVKCSVINDTLTCEW